MSAVTVSTEVYLCLKDIPLCQGPQALITPFLIHLIAPVIENIPLMEDSGQAFIMDHSLIDQSNHRVDIDRDSPRLTEQFVNQHDPFGFKELLTDIIFGMIVIENLLYFRVQGSFCHFEPVMGLHHAIPVLFLIQIMPQIFKEGDQ